MTDADERDPADEAILAMLQERDGRLTWVVLGDGRRLRVFNIAWGYDIGDRFAHVTSNISPGVHEEDVNLFFTSDVVAVVDADGVVLFGADPTGGDAGWTTEAGRPDARLVEVTLRRDRPRLSLSRQLFGTPPRWTTRISTPAGDFELISGPGWSVSGPASVTIAAQTVNVATLKRGLEGTVDGHPLGIRRPRYGWRRAGRSVEITAPGLDLRTDYTASRRYRILRPDGGTVFLRRARELFVDPGASPAELAVAFAVDAAGIVATSSLLYFISMP